MEVGVPPALPFENKVSNRFQPLGFLANTCLLIADLQTSKSLIKGIAQHCIRELINGWKYVRLGDICKITTGKLDANAQVENGQYPFFYMCRTTI